MFLTCGDRDLAADVVDEAFLSVAARLRQVPIENLRGYLWKAAFHGSARSRKRQLRQREAADLAGRRAARTTSGPEDSEPYDDLVASLARLDEQTRIVLVLRFYGDFTVPQIAEHQSLPLGTVKSMIHRGLATLRRDLTVNGSRDQS